MLRKLDTYLSSYINLMAFLRTLLAALTSVLSVVVAAALLGWW